MPLRLNRRKGGKIWYLRGTVVGRRFEESTGLADRALAEAHLAKRQWELEHRAVHGDRGSATFAEAVICYLEHASDKRFIAKLLDHFGHRRLAEINQRAVDDAARALYPSAKPSTLNRQLYTPLSAILHHASHRGLCDPPRLKRPKQPPGKMRWLTHDEAARLIDAAAPHLRHIVIFLLATGARLGEAMGLTWHDVDLTRAHVVFPRTKNGSSRGVPLHPAAVAALAGIAHRTGRVFLTPAGKPYAARQGGGQIKTAWKGAVAKAGLTGVTPHDLRHTWATWHYRANRDLTALQALGGWRTAAMVFRYAHADKGELRGTIDNLTIGENTGKGLGERPAGIASRAAK